MKRNVDSRFPNSDRPGAGGFALVIVLGVLVLVAALAIAFLLRATTERKVSSSYQAAVIARQMADTAVSVVQGQIQMATTGNPDVAWTSQPGMVRTFDTTGNLLKAYKLYSAAEMVAFSAGIVNGKSSDEAPPAWADSPAIWTDLNASIIGLNGVRNYPIVDPAITDGTTVPGCSVASPPGATADQPLPMPVRWLYVLQEGQMVSPSGGSGSAAQAFLPVSPTKENPIVGRIAFWTDDESCKVNINTAGEGTYWDVPRCFNFQEKEYSNYQPANQEFQRYPGHPAMTSLSAVLPSRSTDPKVSLEQFLSLTPRYTFGGSKGGTVRSPGPIQLFPVRLLPSLDELIFNPDRTEEPLLSRADLESRRFLLTAHSRAPETNLFNLPRVAIWPVYELNGTTFSGTNPDPKFTNAFDRLIAFCASTGGGGSGAPICPYFLQRKDAGSSTYDFKIQRNQELYSYLQALTEKTWSGGSFLTKYPRDRDQILTEIFDYIRCCNLYDDNLAIGNQFTTKRSGGSFNQGVSPGHGMVMPGRQSNGTQGFGRFYTVSELGLVFICNAQPDDPNTAGIDESFGSNNPATNPDAFAFDDPKSPLTPGHKKIQAFLIYELFCPMLGWVPIGQNMKAEVSGLDGLKVNGTSLGFPATSTWTMNTVADGIYHNARPWGGNPDWRAVLFDKNATSDQAGPNGYPFVGIPITITVPSGTTTMDFSGGVVTLRLLTIAGDEVQKLKVRLPSGTFPIPDLVTAGTPAVQVGTPPSTIVPATTKEHWWKLNSTGAFYTKDFTIPMKTAGRFRSIEYAGDPGVTIRPQDVVRTVKVKHGDYRMVAALADLDDSGGNVFVRDPHYDSSTWHLAHSFGSSTASTYPPREAGATAGKYIDSITYAATLASDMPSNAPTNATATGDFDTGISIALDGAYCNKPDEGNMYPVDSASNPYFDNGWRQFLNPTYYSPNRQMPSPVMFGSLSTGIFSDKPWQTLLFRPLAAAEAGHPGAAAPKDHLLLDLFWMPVVEPYAISDRFSTGGKIGMNTQIVPFTSIKRNTGLYAIFKAEKIAAFPNSAANLINGNGAFKVGNGLPNDPKYDFRKDIDIPETLKQFDSKFNAGDVFRSASEICDLYIVPKVNPPQTLAGMPAFWDSNRLTGDNVRERLYASIYPRLTTKSNTYTVHVRAQSLRQAPGSDPAVWTEGRDKITGEYRGSTTIERFIDANNPGIPDYAKNASSLSSLPQLDTFYRWRIIENRQFAP